MVLLNLFYFALSGILLILSGIYLVRSLSKLARFLGMSEFSVAFMIMAFATSVSELFVGVSSAISGNPGLSLGNVIGANILNLTLVSGIIILSTNKIKYKSKKIGSDAYLMMISVLLVIVLYVIGNQLSRMDGIILLAFFFINIYHIFKRRERDGKKSTRRNDRRFYWVSIFLLSLIVLFISSNFVVKSASNLAIDLGFSEILLGLFLISIATTLPELVFGLTASSLEHKVMAIGNQLGSVFTNSTLIIGIVAIIRPIKVDFLPFLISAVFMLISAFIFVMFVKKGDKLEKREGITLILIYVVFIIIQFFVR